MSRGWKVAQQLRAPSALMQDPALVPRTKMAAPDYLQLRIPWHKEGAFMQMPSAFCGYQDTGGAHLNRQHSYTQNKNRYTLKCFK